MKSIKIFLLLVMVLSLGLASGPDDTVAMLTCTIASASLLFVMFRKFA